MTAEDSSIPKWKIALAVGGTVVLGAGVYYKFFKVNKSADSKKNSDKPLKKSENKDKLSKDSNGTSEAYTVSNN